MKAYKGDYGILLTLTPEEASTLKFIAARDVVIPAVLRAQKIGNRREYSEEQVIAVEQFQDEVWQELNNKEVA